MQLILQRVSRASVVVDSETVASIARGVLLLVAVETGDTLAEVGKAARKVASLRMFDDSRGHMNLDPRQAEAAFLVVSQFTLAASLDRGRRPSFNGAAPPEAARPMIDALVGLLEDDGFEVQTGRFGAHMKVELVNDGPVTFRLQFP